MTTETRQFVYTGDPSTPVFDQQQAFLPNINLDKAIDPSLYVAPYGLRDAVNVALELGLPLLLTGEPGVGKSSLARSLNRALGYADTDLLHFTVKSDTRDSELFYNYDTLGRFHAVHGQINLTDEKAKADAKAEADARRFIRYQALGLAILQAKGRDNIPSDIMTEEALQKFSPERRRAVVLIDEIDKAPRDMPNDILNEIERMEFRIPELFREELIKLETDEDKKYRPIVIITSNSERELPEAFLRRCLYYDLAMPKFAEDLANDKVNDISIEAIVRSRLNQDIFDNKAYLLNDAIALFRFLRHDSTVLRRKPSLAELLDWLRYLDKSSATTALLERQDLEISIKATLLKNPDDQKNYLEILTAWKKKANR
jgi:MoxR-like ATPase